MVGAIAKVTGMVSLNSVMNSIKANWSGRIGELNAEAARIAYNSIKVG